jgi:hypothetical protein
VPSCRSWLSFVAPLVTASLATLVVGLASQQLSRTLGGGAATVVDNATPIPVGTASAPAAADDPVDYDAAVRRALGEPCPASQLSCDDLWRALDPAQRDEMRILLREVVRIGFRLALAQPADARVEWVHVATPHGDRVVDVVIEGSSLVRNYYTQIRGMMRDPAKGYAFVVERLKRKIERSG